jgi:arylsulfatase A-like enzyme
VLLTLDACRIDVVPPYTPEQSKLKNLLPPRPNLEALEPRVARFLVAYTPSAGTFDTFAALFSGWDLPGILGGVPADQRLDARLAGAGYAVRGFANDPRFGVDSWEESRLVRYPGADGFRMLSDAVAFLDSLPDGQPGFVWVHVLDLHADLLKPLAWETFSHRAHLAYYSRALARVDSMVGDFFGALDHHGLAPSTVVLMSADHGEELGGHGHYHHNLSLYQPAIRVPLWITGPGVVPGPRMARVSLQSLYPTMIEAAGLTPGRTAGQSLWPVLRNESPAVSDSLIYSFLPQRGFSQRYADFYRVEMGQAALLDARRRHKVILRLGLGSWEAYDVSTDSLELYNLAGGSASWPDSLRRMLEAMIRERRRVPRRFPLDPAPSVSRETPGSHPTGGVQSVAPVRQSAPVKDGSSR